LSLSGTTESEITYFMKEPPAKAIVEQKNKNRPNTADTRQSRGRTYFSIDVFYL